MKYIFKSSGGLKGTIFELTPEGKIKRDTITLSPKTKTEYRIAICCQLIAEGGTLTDICDSTTWSPEPLEFYNMIDNNAEWKSWYLKAQACRNKKTIDDTYNKLKEADLGDTKQVERVLILLKTMHDTIKDAEDSDGIKSITNVSAYKIPILEEKGWALED